MKDMAQIMREDARLIILKALKAEVDERLHSDFLVAALEQFGLRKTREWVHVELDWLAEMGAIAVRRVGTVVVAVLADRGAAHLERKIAIEGIKRPGRAED